MVNPGDTANNSFFNDLLSNNHNIYIQGGVANNTFNTTLQLGSAFKQEESQERSYCGDSKSHRNRSQFGPNTKDT